MNERIQSYVGGLFKDVPNNRRIMEIQEELLSNLNEKYEDLLRQGRSEDEAFSIVVSGVGDIDELVADLTEADRKSFTDAAVKSRHGSLLVSIGIFLLIASIPVAIFMSEFVRMGDLGAMIMLLTMGAGIAVIVYGASLNKKKYIKKDDSFVEEYKEKVSKSDKMSRMSGAIASSLWTLVVLTYFIVSFFTYRWDITWVIFLIGAVLQQVLEAIIRKKVNTGGIIWCSAIVIYFVMSFTLYNWHISWLVFLAAAALQQILRLYRIWREE